jgi:hypothetical protein
LTSHFTLPDVDFHWRCRFLLVQPRSTPDGVQVHEMRAIDADGPPTDARDEDSLGVI